MKNKLLDEDKYSHTILNRRADVSENGTFREKVTFGCINNPGYAFGLLTAADLASYFNYEKILAIEIGVAEGGGLRDICNIAKMVTDETGIEIEVYGFDHFKGLPELLDYRDHPEIWREGDFKVRNIEKIVSSFNGKANIVIGDIKDTIPDFITKLDSPIGFVSIDVDTYFSSESALKIFSENSENYLPVVPTFLDDIYGGGGRIGTLLRNRKCGQWLAVDEFNRKNNDIVIEEINSINLRIPCAKERWVSHIHMTHFLQHHFRNKSTRKTAYDINSWKENVPGLWPVY